MRVEVMGAPFIHSRLALVLLIMDSDHGLHCGAET
jgi:hypothetical protein